MDPLDNQTPTPGINPNPEPVSSEPVSPESASPEPVSPESVPVSPVAVDSAPSVPRPVAPTTPDVSAPTNPIINPVVNPVNPVINPSPAIPVTPTAPSQAIGVSDPILRPEPAKAPDPIEEELKAPMKAAAPAPGSIGSAVSGPAEVPDVERESVGAGGQTPSVSFNDPATEINNTSDVKLAKKSNRTTLIILIAIAGMVVIALGAVLIMQIMNK